VLAPRQLPLGGCFVAQPFGIVQGPLTPSTSVLQARFALLATPELRASCGEPPLARPLPPLKTDLSLAEEGVMRLGLVSPLASVERAFVAAAPITASGESIRITQAHVTARGSEVDAELLLGGRVCGELALGARLDFPPDGQFIGLTGALLSASESERLSDAHLDPKTWAPALAAAPHIAPLLSVAGLRDGVPALAAALSPPTLNVTAKVSSAHGAGAVARGADLVAWVEARGAVWLKPR
jgi:hypothetical protein